MTTPERALLARWLDAANASHQKQTMGVWGQSLDRLADKTRALLAAPEEVTGAPEDTVGESKPPDCDPAGAPRSSDPGGHESGPVTTPPAPSALEAALDEYAIGRIAWHLLKMRDGIPDSEPEPDSLQDARARVLALATQAETERDAAKEDALGAWECLQMIAEDILVPHLGEEEVKGIAPMFYTEAIFAAMQAKMDKELPGIRDKARRCEQAEAQLAVALATRPTREEAEKMLAEIDEIVDETDYCQKEWHRLHIALLAALTNPEAL